MVQIIAGRKGKGKTKHLLDMANNGIKAATGSIVYLDKSSKHMYELNNRIRLINVNAVSYTHLSTTLYPRSARPVPMLAVVVVLPTPPFPEVITMTSLIETPPEKFQIIG